MRVDKRSTLMAFDNMEDRPIKGTTDWQTYSLVLNVSHDATGIFFGVLLDGPGAVWLNSAKIEEVGSDVPTTGKVSTQRPDEPRNLDFTEP